MNLGTSAIEHLWFEEADEDWTVEHAKESLAAGLVMSEGFNLLPQVVEVVLAIVAEPRYQTSRLTAAIEGDPALAANVVRAANAALFGAVKPINTISQAVVHLGGCRLRELIISVAIMAMFQDRQGVGKLVRNHCAGTAAIARWLAREFNPEYSDGIFLAGLLHDMGKLLLIQTDEMPYASIENAKRVLATDRIHLDEQLFLGFDHAVLGGYLLAHWNIAAPVPKVVAWHHQPTRAYQRQYVGQLVALLRVADQLEPLIRDQPESPHRAVDALARGVDRYWAGIDIGRLPGHWNQIYMAHRNAMDLFGA